MKRKNFWILLSGSLLICTGHPTYAQETREQNASRLIAQNKALNDAATKLHGKAETDINQANRLKGQAQQLILKVGTPQFKAAAAQYSNDISQFREHANQYNAHLADFGKTIGECHAGQKAYEESLRGYELHVKQFHIPALNDIRPPHICGELNMSASQTARVANQMREDRIRVVQAEKELNDQEMKLGLAEKAELINSKKAVNASIRAQREQELAGEFGKLKEEYDLLKIENKALGGGSSPVVAGIGASSSVHGRIRN